MPTTHGWNQGDGRSGPRTFLERKVEDEGRGAVEKGAHFYRSLQVDAHGNPINKRNAWASRAVVYVRLIPPGAADTVHYRLKVPNDAGDKIRLTAKLCYRKFSWWNTQFSFAGVQDSHTPAAPDYDDRQTSFNGDTSTVSASSRRFRICRSWSFRKTKSR